MSPLPINNDFLIDWVSSQQPFAQDDDFRFVIESEDERQTYGVHGSGPFSADEFKSFGESLDFYVVDMDEELEFSGLTLVLGEENWDKDALAEYLDRALERATQIDYPVRIYSQQMFLLRITAGIDPFNAPLDVLREFGRGHPALDYLTVVGFDWPSCQALPETNREIEPYPMGPEESPLKRLGYKVGRKDGISDSKRRHAILERAFLEQLPWVESSSYMSEWGEPNSSRRLKKMADNLATFVRNAKRREDRMDLAIKRWESDLEWLKQTFYTGKFRFQWPSTD